MKVFKSTNGQTAKYLVSNAEMKIAIKVYGEESAKAYFQELPPPITPDKIKDYVLIEPLFKKEAGNE